MKIKSQLRRTKVPPAESRPAARSLVGSNKTMANEQYRRTAAAR